MGAGHAGLGSIGGKKFNNKKSQMNQKYFKIYLFLALHQASATFLRLWEAIGPMFLSYA